MVAEHGWSRCWSWWCGRTAIGLAAGRVARLAIGGGIVKLWSNGQASIALSSGEAEFYAAWKAATEALGAKSLLRDLGWKARLTLNIDAEAARAIASRQGVGKIRHLEVRVLGLCAKLDHLFVQSLGEDESC